jgi:hypothetical protein
MKQIALLLIAIFLFVLLAPIGFIVQMFYKGRKRYLLNIAISIDQNGNAVCEQLFNNLLITSKTQRFGNCDETISHVLGLNKRAGTLTIAGKVVCYLLNKIENNHVEKAI